MLLPVQQNAGVGMVCSKVVRPEVPKTKWVGRAQYRAAVIVRDGRVTTVEVKTVSSAADEALAQQMAASIERAIRAYECSGNHVFEQEFAFQYGD
jgi:hypothetical protein